MKPSWRQPLKQWPKKGLIFRISKKDNTLYSAAQFVVGIWEYHLNDLDEDLIRDVNEYMPTLMKKSWLSTKTKQLRVVPVAKSVSAEMAIMPFEAAEEIINKQSKIVVSPCICRKEQKMIGKGCDKPVEACLIFGAGAYYYEKNGLGREIDKTEALDILKAGVDAGLVLQPGNQQKSMNICMCCGCCCGVLKNLKTLEKPAEVIHTNYYAQVDEDLCTACEACVERCQMDAITVDEAALVNLDRCIGCGLCVTDCPTEAITLRQKAEDSRYLPPKNVFETYMNIAQEAGADVRRRSWPDGIKPAACCAPRTAGWKSRSPTTAWSRCGRTRPIPGAGAMPAAKGSAWPTTSTTPTG